MSRKDDISSLDIWDSALSAEDYEDFEPPPGDDSEKLRCVLNDLRDLYAEVYLNASKEETLTMIETIIAEYANG